MCKNTKMGLLAQNFMEKLVYTRIESWKSSNVRECNDRTSSPQVYRHHKETCFPGTCFETKEKAHQTNFKLERCVVAHIRGII